MIFFQSFNELQLNNISININNDVTLMRFCVIYWAASAGISTSNAELVYDSVVTLTDNSSALLFGRTSVELQIAQIDINFKRFVLLNECFGLVGFFLSSFAVALQHVKVNGTLEVHSSYIAFVFGKIQQEFVV